MDSMSQTNGCFVDVNLNTWQYITNTSYTPVISPEAPDYYLSNAAAYDVASLQSIQSNTPIAIVLNGGEYGMGVPAGRQACWLVDPRVQACHKRPDNVSIYIQSKSSPIGIHHRLQLIRRFQIVNYIFSILQSMNKAGRHQDSGKRSSAGTMPLS